jgi:hypothetical protein
MGFFDFLEELAAELTALIRRVENRPVENRSEPVCGPTGAGREPMANELIRNLDGCMLDVYRAEKAEPDEAPIPQSYEELLQRLNAARTSIPSEHRNGAADPFRQTLLAIGPEGFNEIWADGSLDNETRNGLLMRDIAQALLERAASPVEEQADEDGEAARKSARERREATDAFQEILFDLYDTFLNPQWRRFRPNFSRLPPAMKWGNPYDMAPYAWDTRATQPFFGVECGVVSMPPAYAKRGLLGWAAAGHECCGHDILSADAGLHAEVEETLKEQIAKLEPRLRPLGQYWLQRWDEAAADVIAIFNIGPTAALALLGFFRARHWARGEKTALACVDKDPDSGHPVDILRAAAWVATLDTLKAAPTEWAEVLARQAEEDLATAGECDPEEPGKGKKIKLRVSRPAPSLFYSWPDAITTAKQLLKSIDEPLRCLGGAKLRDFCDWTAGDEHAVRAMEKLLRRGFCGGGRDDVEFTALIQDLANDRAALRNLESYGRMLPNDGAVKELKERLGRHWEYWGMDGLWAAHVLAAAIKIALRPSTFVSSDEGKAWEKELACLLEGEFKSIVDHLERFLQESDGAKKDAAIDDVRQVLKIASVADLDVEPIVGELRAQVMKDRKVDREAVRRIACAEGRFQGVIGNEQVVRRVFRRMKKLLAFMHNNNRRWGAVEEPGWARVR